MSNIEAAVNCQSQPLVPLTVLFILPRCLSRVRLVNLCFEPYVIIQVILREIF